MRYDFDVPRTERYNRLDWFDLKAPAPVKAPGLPNLKGTEAFAGGNQPRAQHDGDYNNVQPRIGLAYALGGKTSLRAGYGIFYGVSRAGVRFGTGRAFKSQTNVNWSRDSGYTQYATLENPFPDGLRIPGGYLRNPFAFVGFGITTFVRDERNPQYQQWNFSIQRELPGNAVLEVNYAGSKGTHLTQSDVLGERNKLDPIYYSLGRTALNRQVPNPFYGIVTDPNSLWSLPTLAYNRLLRPYPAYGGVGGFLATPTNGNSNYHSVQFKYERRFSQGLAVIAHYTIAKLISDGDAGSSGLDFLGGASGIQSWTNLRLERAVSVFDIPQRAVISFSYELPIGRGKAFGRSMNRLADTLIGGWEFSGILTFSSGYPIIPGLSSGTLWDAAQRPNLIGDPRTSGPAVDRLNQFFNVSAFSQPAPDTLGTAPRTLSNYRSFGIRNGDLALLKNVAVAEGKRLQFRLESFNFTNTPTFGMPNSSYGSSGFGIISGYASGRGPRESQIAVKFYF